MTPQLYLLALRKRWWLIIGLAFVLASAGFAQAKMTTPMYRATAASYATLSQAGNVSELVQGSTYTQNLMQSFALLSTTPRVLDPVIWDLDLDMTAATLAKSITATVPLNSFIIEIQAVSVDPTQAAEIADAVATELAVTAQQLAPSTTGGAATVRLEKVAPATVPIYPFSPNTRMQVMIWGAGGGVLGVLGALVWALTDTRVRREADVEAAAKMPLLGAIPREKKPLRGGSSEPQVSEAFRRFRANLAFVDASRHANAIVITSPSAGEGKTTTSCNLAAALAEIHPRVLLIDCDLRKPTVADKTGLLADAGLTNVLIGQVGLDDVVQSWGNVDVLTSGPVPPNPAQLVESEAMTELIEEARKSYDYVVIDSPPLLPVIDAAMLAQRVGGAVIVARVGRTTRQQLSQAATSLRNLDAETLGGILVGTEQSESYYGSAKASE
ncbi:MAG: polysaccharide biosynthesis tyrosine autokinase [Ancrocorticia sp.]